MLSFLNQPECSLFYLVSLAFSSNDTWISFEVRAPTTRSVARLDSLPHISTNTSGLSNSICGLEQELSELRAEAGVLSRTEEVLKQREESVNEKLVCVLSWPLCRLSCHVIMLVRFLLQSVVEKQKGVSGYRETQDALENISSLKSELDGMKGRTLEDISYMVQQLNTKITAKKTALAPIIKELRPLRQRAQVRQDLAKVIVPNFQWG